MFSTSNVWLNNQRNRHPYNQRFKIPYQNSMSTYSTDTKSLPQMKPFDGVLINNFHKLPNNTKNLTDIIQENKMAPTEIYDKGGSTRTEFSLTGIGNFFINAVSVIGEAMSFSRRTKTPAPQYHDCVDDLSDGHNWMVWQDAKADDQNKNGAPNVVDMNADCKTAAASCEDKLLKVRQLLSSKTVIEPTKTRLRRPRRVFVEARSVEDNFVDAFTPEDFVRLANDDFVECLSLFGHHNAELWETDSPRIKTEFVHYTENLEPVPYKESVTKSALEDNIEMDTKNSKLALEIPENCTEIKLEKEIMVQQNVIEEPDQRPLDNKLNSKIQLYVTEEPLKSEIKFTEIKMKGETIDTEQKAIEIETEKREIISCCEDKMNILKSLLSKRQKTKPSSDSVPEPVVVESKHKSEKVHDKHFKNPHRLSGDKRRKQCLRKNIIDDMVYANEIDSEDLSSIDGSPSKQPSIPSTPELEKDCFNEITGRFNSETESENFQIVFADCPRRRKMSDCESEDSFIVFEDSPDSCYVSNDVFSDESSDDENMYEMYSHRSQDDSDSGSGEVSMSRFSPFMTRTVRDLTDDSLYEENCCDEVDCAVRICEEIPSKDLDCDSLKSSGLLIDEAKRQLKRQEPPKKVTFATQPPKVHVMRVWTFAARQARAGHWEQLGRDRDRFKRRITDVEMAISWVLKPQHRSRVVFQRFMPWWNAQKRKELAEKKRREEEEKLKQDEEGKDLDSKKISTVSESETTSIDKIDTENLDKVGTAAEKAHILSEIVQTQIEENDLDTVVSGIGQTQNLTVTTETQLEKATDPSCVSNNADRGNEKRLEAVKKTDCNEKHITPIVNNPIMNNFKKDSTQCNADESMKRTRNCSKLVKKQMETVGMEALGKDSGRRTIEIDLTHKCVS